MCERGYRRIEVSLSWLYKCLFSSPFSFACRIWVQKGQLQGVLFKEKISVQNIYAVDNPTYGPSMERHTVDNFRRFKYVFLLPLFNTLCYHQQTNSTVHQWTYGPSMASVPPYLMVFSSQVVELLSVTMDDSPWWFFCGSMNRRSILNPIVCQMSQILYQLHGPSVVDHNIQNITGSTDRLWLSRSSLLQISAQSSVFSFWTVFL